MSETARQRLFLDLRMPLVGAVEFGRTGRLRDFLSFFSPSQPLFMKTIVICPSKNT